MSILVFSVHSEDMGISYIGISIIFFLLFSKKYLSLSSDDQLFWKKIHKDFLYALNNTTKSPNDHDHDCLCGYRIILHV